MLTINTVTVLLIVLLSFDRVRSLRPPKVAEGVYCGLCPKTKNFPSGECYKVPERKISSHWCCKCRPGTYPSEPCKNGSPQTTTCTPCPSGTYVSEYNNETECFKSRLRQSCRPLLHTQFVRGNASVNNKCACKHGTYSRDPEKTGCKPHLECPEGFGVLTPGNSSHDVTCEHCKDGYYSNTSSSVEKCRLYMATISPKNLSSGVSEFNTLTTVTSSTDANEDSTTVTDTTRSSTMKNKPEGLSTGGITGIVIGSIAIVGIVIFAVFLYKKWKKRNQGHAQDPGSGDNSSGPDGPLQKVTYSANNGHAQDAGSGDDASAKYPLLGRESENNGNSSNNNHNNDSNSRNQDMAGSEENPNSKSQKSDKKKSSQDDLIVDKHTQSGGADKAGTIEGKTFEAPDGEVKAQPISTISKPAEKNTKLSPEQYTEIFRQKNYNVVYNPRTEGDCQYEAILWTENGRHESDCETVAALRNQVANYLVNNKRHFEGRVAENFEQYINGIREHEFGDENTLAAAATILKKKIIVIQTFSNRDIETEPLDGTPVSGEPIILGHVDEDHGMHYVRLGKINQSVVGQISAGSPPIQDDNPIIPPAAAHTDPIAQNRSRMISGSSEVPSQYLGDTRCTEESDNNSDVDRTQLHRSESTRSQKASVSRNVLSSSSDDNANANRADSGINPSITPQDFATSERNRQSGPNLTGAQGQHSRSRIASASGDVSSTNLHDNVITEGAGGGLDPVAQQDLVTNGQNRQHDVFHELPTLENCQQPQNSNNGPVEQIENGLVQEIMDVIGSNHDLGITNEDLRHKIELFLDVISDIGHKMLESVQEQQYSNVRNYLRSTKLLKELEINDIIEDNKDSGVKEIRYKWILRITEKYGKKGLTPRVLLNLKYQDAVFKEKMMEVFIKELKTELPSLP